MQTLVAKIAAARLARRRSIAEQKQALWEEHRRAARRSALHVPCRFAGA